MKKASRAALVAALVLAGCGSSSSGQRTDPGTDPGIGPGPGPGTLRTGTCTASGAATGTVPVTVICTNVTGNGAWTLSLIDTREPIGQLPSGGGVFYFGLAAPQLGHDYALTDAYVDQYWPFFSFITAAGRWAAGDSRFADLTRGVVRVNLSACANGTAGGTVTATLTPDEGASGDVQMTCTF